MKNKNLLWGILIFLAAVVVAILLGLSSAGYDSMQNAGTQSNTTTGSTSKTTTTSGTKTASKPAAPIAGMQTSLGGIFAAQGNYECDYNAVSGSTNTMNTVYVSNGKLRGEFRTTTAGVTTANIVVYDGSHLYLWIEGRATGTVSQPKTLADLPGIIPTDVSSGRILGSGLNNASWICHAWSLNPSMLAKPTYVTFN